MKLQPVKGTRDFYPEDMAVRNWIIDGWKKVSIRNGFAEYDGPIFEYLKMFQVKSGEEIAEQLFSLKDRGGRDLAIRPEMTPTLARMVNQQINSLPKPIKWFSVPRLCRAERPQKGRFREFFQWNIDIIGVDDVLADAEIIFTTIDYLRYTGLTKRDVKIKISSRKLLSAGLQNIGIHKNKLDPLFAMLDKYDKMPLDKFEKYFSEEVADKVIAKKILDFMAIETLSEVPDILGSNKEIDQAMQELAELLNLLEKMGVKEYCDIHPGIVRGLAYYTGIVFEVHALSGELRAIAGGGRFDNLLHDFGGPSIAATGMGMGDCVLEILLRYKGLINDDTVSKKLDYFVALVDDKYKDKLYEITAKLRRKGKSANFSYKLSGLSKQLKEASAQNAAKCIIVGSEMQNGQIIIKDMDTNTTDQEIKDCNDFLNHI
ncbi:MAG: histidine--tRNA ligase [Planctomycetota bacterium]|jgi:histidyl-tRNA synthetase